MIELKPQVLKSVPSVNPIAITMGDPDRVLLLSKLLDEYKIVFHNRGIVIVNGKYRSKPVTLASHGIGCPMASIIFEELGMLGAKTIIRMGTAGSLRNDLLEGDILLAAGAGYKLTGCSTNMYSPDIHGGASPDPILLSKIYNYLVEKGLNPRIGLVFTSDAFYSEQEIIDSLIKRGFSAIDMETAILYILGWMRGWKTLSILVISNNLLRKTPLKTTMELKEKFILLTQYILDIL